MDIMLLERNANLGVYDLNADHVTDSGQVKTGALAMITAEKLRKQLREDCILAAIHEGCTRKGSKHIFQLVYESTHDKGNREVARTMIAMIKKCK